MTRSDNLVDRLRDVGWCGWDTQQEAADEIERLRAENRRLHLQLMIAHSETAGMYDNITGGPQ